MILNHKTIDVSLGQRSYPIHIGIDLLDQTGGFCKAHFKDARVLIVSDHHVSGLHLQRLITSLDKAHIVHDCIILPAGEATKSWVFLQQIVDKALDIRLERNDVIVAFGGGVIGDLAGFAASIILRGMRVLQIPTSLLAQVDSSVGGKTGINSAHGKNLIGAFHQPSMVIADSAVLDTLSLREFKAGYAEMVKYSLINDASFFEWLERYHGDVFKGGAARIEAVAKCCQAKAHIVADDETEQGARALLNLGHTFGHALEAATHYRSDILVHGEGVAIGMMMAFRFSERLGLVEKSEVERVQTHFEAVGLPISLAHLEVHLPDNEALLAYIAQDKKVARGALTFILTRGIGKSFIARDVNRDDVKAFLDDFRFV